MTRINDHNKAIVLRKQGMSYSQIKNELGISKSTLSCWLNNLPLSKERLRELRDNSEVRIEKFRETMRKKKEKRLKAIYFEQKKKIFPFSDRDLFIAGLFLYWGEGTKTDATRIRLANTDPAMIKFFIKWTGVCFKIPKEKLRIDLQLYSDMNITKEINYWSKKLKISTKQFTKPYIKKTNSQKIEHNKGGFKHGTCNIRFGNARLSERVLMSIKAITDEYLKMRP